MRHVADATRGDSTLDLLLTSSDDARARSVADRRTADVLQRRPPRHQPHIGYVPRDKPTILTYQYRDLRHVDIEAGRRYKRSTALHDRWTTTHGTFAAARCSVCLTSTPRLRNERVVLDVTIVGRWLSAEARDAKRRCRRLERRFSRTRSTVDKLAFRAAALQ